MLDPWFHAPPRLEGEDESDERVPSLADKLVERIRHEMKDSWRQDERLLQKFFPIEPASISRFSPKARKELYNDNKNQNRWKGIPSKPNLYPISAHLSPS